MIAFYGFKDGSGEWFLRLYTDRCNGCGACANACPVQALEVGPDEADPLRGEPVMKIKDIERKKLRYTCAPCKPGYGEQPTPCAAVCQPAAISHTEAWENMYGAR